MPFIETVAFPARFRPALAGGDLKALAEQDCADAAERLARGLVRLQLGREAEARADFEAGATPACRLEIAFLDLRRRQDPKGLIKLADEMVAAEAGDSLLAARANHLAGLAENQLRRLQPATDRLLDALEIYERLECRPGTAQVNDGLGMVLASRGLADLAALHYALSLADKGELSDREGLAITLGNLGRLALQQGRYRDAIAFFKRDTAILRELRNDRAEARLKNDAGRAFAGMEEFDAALQELAEAQRLAAAGGFLDIWLMSLREIALVHLRRGEAAPAEAALAEAKAKLPAEGYLLERAALAATEGQLLAHKGDTKGFELMESAVKAFTEARLPDLEIQTRIALAEACAAKGLAKSAEAGYFAALKGAMGEGLQRYVRPIKEALARLDVQQSAIEEAPRPLVERVGDAEEQGYVKRARLGAGAFGTVFHAFDLQSGRDVAFKRIHLSALYDAGERDRLIQSAKAELEAAAAIRHPGVVRVYNVGAEPNGDLYVVQELVKGEGLHKIMAREGAKGAAEVAPYLLRIAQALDALHRAGVVHRDLKPGNVIVKNGWQPVLVDFGISHVPGRAQVAKDNLGTLEYTAPEQAAGEAAEAQADLYALGVIAYEWLTGRRPLEIPPDLDEAIRVLRKQDPVPLRKLRPDLPKEFCELVDQLLEKKPKKRPASAAEVADRLAPFAS
jgi:tetratricopeptide (TPR) repeat protein